MREVLSQTARTDEERREADRYFLEAAKNDFRHHNYGAYLHRAIVLLTNQAATASEKAQAVDFLKQYMIGYHLSNAEAQRAQTYNLPPHLESVYDYLARAGEVRSNIRRSHHEAGPGAGGQGVLHPLRSGTSRGRNRP